MPRKRKVKGQSLSSYFRKVFTEKPEWLEQKSNDVVLARFRTDHGLAAGKDVGKSVKGTMANMKSLLRREIREGRNGKGPKAKAAPGAWAVKAKPSKPTLETLEEQIDDCMVAAKNLDRAALEHVIRLLRHARNAVVWKFGQKE
jgi:hypothetical protein